MFVIVSTAKVAYSNLQLQVHALEGGGQCGVVMVREREREREKDNVPISVQSLIQQGFHTCRWTLTCKVSDNVHIAETDKRRCITVI